MSISKILDISKPFSQVLQKKSSKEASDNDILAPAVGEVHYTPAIKSSHDLPANHDGVAVLMFMYPCMLAEMVLLKHNICTYVKTSVLYA